MTIKKGQAWATAVFCLMVIGMFNPALWVKVIDTISLLTGAYIGLNVLDNRVKGEFYQSGLDKGE